MANTKSAQRRIKINQRNYYSNTYYKHSINTLTKNFKKALKSNLISDSEAQQKLNKIYSLIDKSKKKRIFHKNTAARKKANLLSYFKHNN